MSDRKRAAILDALSALDDRLGHFEQTTHAHIPIHGVTIRGVAEALVAAYETPGAYEISNLSQEIRRFVRQEQKNV